MLVLTRRLYQRVLIGDDIIVQVVEMMGDRVRLGFEAPRDMVIVREELSERRPRHGTPETAKQFIDRARAASRLIEINGEPMVVVPYWFMGSTEQNAAPQDAPGDTPRQASQGGLAGGMDLTKGCGP